MLHTHEVDGSSPPVSTKQKTTQPGGFFVWYRHSGWGTRRCQMQYAGGILLTPVPTLVAPLINESASLQSLFLHPIGWSFCLVSAFRLEDSKMSNAICQWHIADTSANTGSSLDYIKSPFPPGRVMFSTAFHTLSTGFSTDKPYFSTEFSTINYTLFI